MQKAYPILAHEYAFWLDWYYNFVRYHNFDTDEIQFNFLSAEINLGDLLGWLKCVTAIDVFIYVA